MAVGALAAVGLPLAGGTTASAAPNPYPTGPGYWLGAADGGIFNYGDAQFYGSAGNLALEAPVVGIEANPFYEGYWEVATDGGIFSYGSSSFFGSTGNVNLAQPIVGMASHPSGLGYWLVAADGGVFSYGASKFKGSTGGIALQKPIVGMTATPSGNGYWLVASDGGVFNFGDAQFLGSAGAVPLVKPVVDLEATPSGNGYWLVASDGGIFSYGAPFFGSAGAIALDKPVVGMSRTANGGGYQLVASDGGIFSYGNALFQGSTGGIPLVKPVIGMARRPPLAISVDPFNNDDATRSSSWELESGDERLVLRHGAAGTTAAGALVLGAEGLNVGQLGQVGFTVEAGSTCGPSGPYLAVYADTNGDGAFDLTNKIQCTGTGAQTVSLSAVSGGSSPLPANAVVTGIDLLFGGVNSTVRVDDIRVAGITVTDHRVFTNVGTILG